MPKRKGGWDLPPLEELLQRVFCYYCERTFVDVLSLQEHMKHKHLQCLHCRKKMDSLGGLRVHVESVHKIPLDKIQNALPDRESAEGPEIYLMEGVPPELKDAFYAEIRKEYERKAYEYRMETGNPVPGSLEAQERAKRVKLEEKETPQEKQIRKAAFLAQRRAEIAAKKAAKERGEDIKEAPKDDFISQEPNFKLDQNDQAMGLDQASQAFGSTQPFTGYHANYAGSPPMGGLPATQAPPGFGIHPAHAPANYGQPHPFQSNLSEYTYPQQHTGYGYAGQPQGFAPQPMAGRSTSTHQSPITKTEPSIGVNGKTTMPAAPPGLPQKPSFDLPNYSKEDMQKLHAGRQVPILKSAAGPAAGPSTLAQAVQSAGVSMSPPAKSAESLLPTSNHDLDTEGTRVFTEDNFSRAIDDLLSGGGHGAEGEDSATVNTQPSVPTTTAEPKEKKATAAAAKDKNTVYKANIKDTMSPEEKKSKQSKYGKRSKSTNKKRHAEARYEGSVIEQADSQAVTGRVADDLEQ